MNSIVKIYSENPEELFSFLEKFFSKKPILNNKLYWEKEYPNPIEIADIVAAFIDNKANFPTSNMWVSIDRGAFINIKEDNYNSFIKYLFERYPY